LVLKVLNLWVFCVDVLEVHSKGLLHKICYWRFFFMCFTEQSKYFNTATP